MNELFFLKILKFLPQKKCDFIFYEGFKRYFKNTSWMFLGQLLNSSISFLIGILIARYLGPLHFGELNLIISFVGIFGFLANLGSDSILYRELVNNPKNKNQLLGSGFFIMILGGFFAMILSSISGLFFFNDFDERILVFIYSLTFLLQSSSVISIFFQSKVKSSIIVITQLLTIIISSLLKIYFIMAGLDFRWFIYSYLIEAIILFILRFFSYKLSGFNIIKWTYDLGLVKKIIKDSWPIMFSALSISIYMKIDQLMIGKMLDVSSVGIYSVAVRLSEIWYLIPSIVCISFFPAILNAKKNNEAIYNKRLRWLYFFLFWSSFLLAVIINFSASILVNIFYGPAYIEAAFLLKIHIWSGIGVFLGYAVHKYLVAENHGDVLFFSSFIGVIVNLFFNFLLIPVVGLVGAAIATMIAYWISTFSIIFFKKTRKEFFNLIQGILIFFNGYE